MDKLHVSDVEAAGAAGVSLKNITLHRGPDGALLDGYFLRDAEGRWTYTGGLRTGDEVAQVAGLRMSPWAGTALDEVLRRAQAEPFKLPEQTEQMERYRSELRDDVQAWLRAMERDAKTRKRKGPPPKFDEIPEGLLRIAWVTDVVFGGNHHTPTPHELVADATHTYVCIRLHGTIGSFDFSEMTRIVVAAHEAAVRAEIMVGGFRQLELMLHARVRTGGMAVRHPDLEAGVAAVKAFRWQPCPFPVPAGVVEGPAT